MRVNNTVWWVLLFFLAVPLVGFAQTREVSGTVTADGRKCHHKR